MIRRLRVKFICINMAVVTVMLLAILGMLLHFTHDNLEQQSIRVMQSVMADRASPGRPGEFPRQAQLPYFYVSVNTLGELSASFGGYYDLTDTAAIQQIITMALNSGEDTGILKDYSLRFQKRTTPFGQTIVFVDMSSELATMRSLTNTCIGIGVLGFAVFLGLSFLLARWAVKPVETAWNQQRQFVADASHELKTPLTVILSNAELLEGAGLTDKPARWSGNIRSEARQMSSLVEQMLTLARADNGVRPAAMEAVNLSDVATDCALAFEPVAFEAGKPLEDHIAEDVAVTGDADRLRRLISILVDNAVKYGAEGGTITLALEKTDRQARLTVANPGEPIPPEDLAHLFERFYRADTSRGEKTGFGLGLSIADTIAREHKGTLKAESDADSTRFIFTMPLKR